MNVNCNAWDSSFLLCFFFFFLVRSSYDYWPPLCSFVLFFSVLVKTSTVLSFFYRFVCQKTKKFLVTCWFSFLLFSLSFFFFFFSLSHSLLPQRLRLSRGLDQSFPGRCLCSCFLECGGALQLLLLRYSWSFFSSWGFIFFFLFPLLTLPPRSLSQLPFFVFVYL